MSLPAVHDFVRRLWAKINADDAFFIAAALAWGLLFSLIPLLALGIGLTGFVLSARFDDPTDAVLTLFARVLPDSGNGIDVAGLLQRLVGEVMSSRTGLTIVGSLVFIWLATRLTGSLRSALSTVFETGVRRGVVHGKFFDVIAVILGVVLVTFNLGVTVLFTAAVEFGVGMVGLGGPSVTFAERFLGFALAFASIWTLFILVYHFLPARRTPWKTTIIAATISGLLHEALKFAFSWYLTEAANYTSTLGNFATVAVLLFWIYYGALVFILGGEAAHVYTNREAAS